MKQEERVEPPPLHRQPDQPRRPRSRQSPATLADHGRRRHEVRSSLATAATVPDPRPAQPPPILTCTAHDHPCRRSDRPSHAMPDVDLDSSKHIRRAIGRHEQDLVGPEPDEAVAAATGYTAAHQPTACQKQSPTSPGRL